MDSLKLGQAGSLGEKHPKGSNRMLVFTRRNNESLVIGNEIEITILSIGSGNVKIGINAPRHIAVHRREVFESIRRQNPSAKIETPKDLPE